jgi:hypothetical protein
VNTVGADHRVGLHARAVCERERDLPRALFEANQLLVEVEDFLDRKSVV